mgnify:CR=1 FL=1
MTAVDHIRARTDLVPRVGIVLGSGLGAVADAVQDAVSFAYAELPGFPQGSVAGHARALHLDALARGAALPAPFGPLQPDPLLPP